MLHLMQQNGLNTLTKSGEQHGEDVSASLNDDLRRMTGCHGVGRKRAIEDRYEFSMPCCVMDA